jgi:hypothetical protein
MYLPHALAVVASWFRVDRIELLEIGSTPRKSCVTSLNEHETGNASCRSQAVLPTPKMQPRTARKEIRTCGGAKAGPVDGCKSIRWKAQETSSRVSQSTPGMELRCSLSRRVSVKAES